MNNLKKIGLSALAGSLAAVSVNAAELSVSGGAALYIGTTNENGAGYYSMGDSITFSGSGQTDGGLNIAVSFELDGNDPAGAKTDAASATSPSGSNVLDNRSVTISTEALGTITWSGHGGDSVVSGWDDMTPTAYEEVWDLTDGADTNRIAGASGSSSVSSSFWGGEVTMKLKYCS